MVFARGASQTSQTGTQKRLSPRRARRTTETHGGFTPEQSPEQSWTLETHGVRLTRLCLRAPPWFFVNSVVKAFAAAGTHR